MGEGKSENLYLCVNHQFISMGISQSYFHNTKCMYVLYFHCVYLLESCVINRKVFF